MWVLYSAYVLTSACEISTLYFFIIKKGNDIMFEVCETMLKQLVDCFPVIFGVYLIFDFVGSLLFGKS